MYTITVHTPNPPLLIRRTYNLDSTLDVEQIVAYCEKHGLECTVKSHATQTVDDVINSIEHGLYLAANRRVV